MDIINNLIKDEFNSIDKFILNELRKKNDVVEAFVFLRTLTRLGDYLNNIIIDDINKIEDDEMNKILQHIENYVDYTIQNNMK